MNSYGDNEDGDNMKMLYAVDMINVDTLKGITATRTRKSTARFF